MKTKNIVSLLLILTSASFSKGIAQYAGTVLPQYPEEWNSQWITLPGIDKTNHGLVHFRNTFTLAGGPDKFAGKEREVKLRPGKTSL